MSAIDKFPHLARCGLTAARLAALRAHAPFGVALEQLEAEAERASLIGWTQADAVLEKILASLVTGEVGVRELVAATAKLARKREGHVAAEGPRLLPRLDDAGAGVFRELVAFGYHRDLGHLVHVRPELARQLLEASRLAAVAGCSVPSDFANGRERAGLVAFELRAEGNPDPERIAEARGEAVRTMERAVPGLVEEMLGNVARVRSRAGHDEIRRQADASMAAHSEATAKTVVAEFGRATGEAPSRA